MGTLLSDPYDLGSDSNPPDHDSRTRIRPAPKSTFRQRSATSSPSRRLVHAAGRPLEEAARASGELRGDLRPEQRLELVGAVAKSPGDQVHRAPMLEAVLDGIRPGDGRVDGSALPLACGAAWGDWGSAVSGALSEVAPERGASASSRTSR